MAKPRRQRRPKAKGRRRANLREATVLIPLTYNDGTRVPRDTIESIYEELYLAFHGWTVEGTVKGAYRMQTGQQRVEDLLKVSVILDESQLRELEAMVARWCAKLGQETMLVRIANFIIEFVPPHTEAQEP
jgi:hypothetical protein